MIVYLANKSQLRKNILSNRIEEIVHESFKGALGKSVGASELASWKNSLRHMDTVMEDSDRDRQITPLNSLGQSALASAFAGRL